MKRIQDPIRLPEEKPFGMQPVIPEPLTQIEIDELRRQEEELGLSGHELEPGKVPGFLSPEEAPVTPMERRAEELQQLHAELARPEEGQFLDETGQTVRAAAPVQQVHDIAWQSKTYKQWKALHRKTERAFEGKMSEYRAAQADLGEWRTPIKKVTPENSLELIRALSQSARYREVTSTNARYLQSFARPSVKSRFEKMGWKTTTVRGRKISAGVATKLSQLATSLRESHNRTQMLTLDDMLPILQAIGETKATNNLTKIRSKINRKVQALRDASDELAIDGHRYEYAMQQRAQTPAKPRKKRGIASKVKQAMQRESPDLSADTAKPEPKRRKGPHGRLQEEEVEEARFGTPPPKRQNVASGPGPFHGRFTQRHERAQHAMFYRARAGGQGSRYET